MTLFLPAGFRLVDLVTVASTNDEAMARAAEGADNGLLVRARQQTAGRGRRGRAFVSPPGNLYVSLVLRPDSSAEQAALVGFAVSLAMAEAIDDVAPTVPAASCKWPNDILVDGKKTGAVLIEASSTSKTIDRLVVGMGINLVSHPDIADYPAGDLLNLGAPGVTSDAMLSALTKHLVTWLDVWRDEGMSGLREPWMARAAGLGQRIQVRLEQESFSGRFCDLDVDGALVLELESGGHRRVTAGAVFFAEAA